MSVLNKEEFFQRLKERIGEDTSDETLTFLEDVTDTYNELEGRETGKEDWEEKYRTLDETWKKKYKERFFSAGNETTPPEVKEEQEENIIDDGEKRTFEELFEEREG